VDQPLERAAFAGFSSRLTAGLIDWLIVFAALWIAVIIQAVIGSENPVVWADSTPIVAACR
jgi:uncharacterized RDD family membrane protein YckC